MQDRHERRFVLRAVPRDHRRRELLRVMATGSRTRVPTAHAIGAAQLVAWGVTFYALPPLLPHISDSLDVSVSSLTLAITIGMMLNAAASLAVASWIHRSGARIPMVTGSIVASIALAALACSGSGATAGGAIALLGAAHAALLYEPAFAAVSSQTHDRIARTRAIQIITFWGGWAGLWSIPTASFLGSSIGWRATLVVLAVLLAVHTIHVHARLAPPLGRSPARVRTRPPPTSLALAAAFALGAFATTAVVVNGLMLLADRRVSVALGSIVFALLAAPQVLGRVWFMRRQGQLRRHDGSLPFVLVAAGVVALLAAPSTAALAIFVVLFGAGTGLLTTVRAAVVVLRVDPEHVAKQLGVYNFASSIARSFAPAVSTWLYVAVGYEAALLVFAALALVAAVLVWRATSCACATAPRSECSSWLTAGELSCAS